MSDSRPISFNMLPPATDTDMLVNEDMPKSNGWPWRKLVAFFGGVAATAVAGSLVYNFAHTNSMAPADATKVFVASTVDFGNGCTLDQCQLDALANQDNQAYTCQNFQSSVVLESFLLDGPLHIEARPFRGGRCGSASGEIVPLATNELHLRYDPVIGQSGCFPEDFIGFPVGAIALIQRGTCFFIDKAINAQNAGASGVIIFNQGNSAADFRNSEYSCQEPEPDFYWDFFAYSGTCGLTKGIEIPAVFVSFQSGVKLSVLGGNATITNEPKVGHSIPMSIPENFNAFPTVPSSSTAQNSK